MALASAGRQLGRPDILRRARQHYGTALRRLGTCLNEPLVANQEAIQITIYLMELYEVCVVWTAVPYRMHLGFSKLTKIQLILNERCVGAGSPWSAHVSGRHALFRLRGREQLRTPAGRSLFAILYLQDLLSGYCGDSEPLAECYTWTIEEVPPSPITSLVLLMHDVCSFLHRVKRLLKKGKAHYNEIWLLLKHSTELEEMIIDLRHVLLSGDASDSDVMHFYSSGAFATRQNFEPGFVVEYLRCHVSRTSSKLGRARAMESTEKDVLPASAEECAMEYYNHLTSDEHLRPPKCCAANTTQANKGNRKEGVKLHLSILRAVPINMTRAMHISLLQAMERLLRIEILSSPDDPCNSPTTYIDMVCELSHARVEQLAKDILDEIPYGLGEIDSGGMQLLSRPAGTSFKAYLSLWPLQTALGTPHLSTKVRNRLERRLKNIYNVFGIGIALDLPSLPADVESEVGSDRDDLGDGAPNDATLNDDHVCIAQFFPFHLCRSEWPSFRLSNLVPQLLISCRELAVGLASTFVHIDNPYNGLRLSCLRQNVYSLIKA